MPRFATVFENSNVMVIVHDDCDDKGIHTSFFCEIDQHLCEPIKERSSPPRGVLVERGVINEEDSNVAARVDFDSVSFQPHYVDHSKTFGSVQYVFIVRNGTLCNVHRFF